MSATITPMTTADHHGERRVSSSSAGRSGPIPRTMRAAHAERYGPPSVLAVRDVSVPTVGKGEVLVQVAAAGLSRAALHLLTGTPYLLRLAGFGLRAPKRAAGIEVAGTVVAVGAEVTRFAVGDEVFGYAPGSFAEFAVAKEQKLSRRPAAMPVTQAAALVDSASTALQAVRDHAAVQPGQRVLVLGASGGVGSFAVQIAAALGAEVTGTASTAKVDFVRGLGASDVVDHSTADPLATDRPYDVIIDGGGNRPVRALRRALAPAGTLVIVGGEGGGPITGGILRQLLAPLRAIGSSQSLKMFTTKEHHGSLEDLVPLVADGSIAPAIDQVHPLADARVAMERMATGAICGKDVIEVSAV